VSIQERALEAVQDMITDATPSHSQLEHMAAQLLWRHEGLAGTVVCDLCDRDVPTDSHVWTCENGDGTIKHALEYDICESCFRHYTGGAVEDTGSESDSDESSESKSDGSVF